MCVEQHGKSGWVSFVKYKVQYQCSCDEFLHKRPLLPLFDWKILKIWKSGNPTELVLERTMSPIRAVSVRKFVQTWILFFGRWQTTAFQNEVTCDPRLNPSKPALHPDVQVHTQFKLMTFLSIHMKFTKEPQQYLCRFYHCPVHLFMSCPLSMDCIEVPSHLYHQHLCHHWHRYCYAEQMPDALGIWRHLCITPSLPQPSPSTQAFQLA